MKHARAIGVALLVQYAVVVAVKLHTGLAHDLLWWSHVCLLASAVGFVRRDARIIQCAAVGVLLPHTAWLLDAAALGITGRSPFGITAYLEHATLAGWGATLHHFYLLPLLVWVVARTPRGWRPAWLTTTTAFAVLLLLTRLVTMPWENVNYAHGLLADSDLAIVHAVNRLPVGAYFVVVVSWMAASFGLGVWLLTRIRAVYPSSGCTAKSCPKAMSWLSRSWMPNSRQP